MHLVLDTQFLQIVRVFLCQFQDPEDPNSFFRARWYHILSVSCCIHSTERDMGNTGQDQKNRRCYFYFCSEIGLLVLVRVVLRLINDTGGDHPFGPQLQGLHCNGNPFQLLLDENEIL